MYVCDDASSRKWTSQVMSSLTGLALINKVKGLAGEAEFENILIDNKYRLSFNTSVPSYMCGPRPKDLTSEVSFAVGLLGFCSLKGIIMV